MKTGHRAARFSDAAFFFPIGNNDVTMLTVICKFYLLLG